MAVSFRGLNVSCTLHVNTSIWPQHFLYQAPFLSLPLLLQTMMAVFQETLWKGQLVLVALIIKAEQFLLLGGVAPPVNLPESLARLPAVMYLFTFLQKRRHWGIKRNRSNTYSQCPSLDYLPLMLSQPLQQEPLVPAQEGARPERMSLQRSWLWAECGNSLPGWPCCHQPPSEDKWQQSI